MKSLKSARLPLFRASQQTVMNSSPPLLSLRVITIVRPSEAHPSTLTMSPWKVTMCIATPHPIPCTAKGPLPPLPALLLAHLPVLLLACLPAHLLVLLAAPLVVLRMELLMMMATMMIIRMTRQTEFCCSSQEWSPPSLVPPLPPANPPNLSIG